MIIATNGMAYIDETTVEKTDGGIHLPQNQRHGKTEVRTGVIHALDKAAWDKEDGPCPFDVGDTVLFIPTTVIDVHIDGKKLMIVGMNYIMGITEKGTIND